MKVALDVMGGDNAPISTVHGAYLSLKEINDLKLILVGKREIIEEEIKKYNFNQDRIEIFNASETILMTDDPIRAVKEKKDSSMIKALELVKENKACASVSAGNTGALISASQLKLKRIKGILRPAIASIFPNKNKEILVLDLGATADSKAEFLNQYAMMGTKYMEILFGRKNPKVALLNIGEEQGKGNELTRNAYEILKNNDKINFVGNIESTNMLEADIDIVVTDGFTGNILLKTSEGIAKLIFKELKEEIQKSFINKIGAILLKPAFKKIRAKLDSSEYGGAIFLGLNGLSIKAHGNSDAIAIKNAIKTAYIFAKKNFIEEIKKEINKQEEK